MQRPSSSAGAPAPGDLLITKDTSESETYTISIVPGPPQVRYGTYALAVSAASAWASQQGVAIWSTEDSKTFSAVAPKKGGATTA
jgi:hypothetical protein